MPVNDAALYVGLDKLLDALFTGVEDGLSDEATQAEAEMYATFAHGDITGATRASYRAFVIGGTHTGASEAASGYAAAQAAISGAIVSHGGAALSQDSGISLSQDERGVLLTSYTDYQDKLETEKAAQKAVLGPTLQSHAQGFTAAAAKGSRSKLGS